MITTIDEAKELCKKFDINLKDHKVVIVTGNNSIYLSDNIDPSDKSELFYLKGGTVSIEEVKEIQEIVSEKIEEIKSYKKNK